MLIMMWSTLRYFLSPLATTQDNLDDKLRKFEIRDMMGLTDDRDISETVSETWSTDVLGSDFDPNMDEDRLQEIAGETFVMNSLTHCISHVIELPKKAVSYFMMRGEFS